MTDPASIRFKNPGAMWGNALAKKYGALDKAVILHDGLGQGNNIAVFPDYVHGAAAQFALWNQSYAGMTLKAAILKWSGGNWSQPYMDFLIQHTGLTPSSPITKQVLSSPTGLKLMKAQAQWEAGRPYPMTDNEWSEAQAMVFGVPSPPAASPSVGHVEVAPEAPKAAEGPSILSTITNWFRTH